MKPETLSFRPHARLLTMLGDQLIKNQRIALVELIKNAYDADADRIEVRFEDFNKNMTPNSRSRIVLRDDGDGMAVETVRKEWMNPATPVKYLAKHAGRGKTPRKKRIIQGEKGIGRFAVLKLGQVVTITTKPRNADLETVLAWDFSRFDDDFVSEGGERKEIFLDQIEINCLQSKPRTLSGSAHGTVIEIRRLKGTWGWPAIRRLCRDVFNLTDPVSRITDREAKHRLEIAVFCNGQRQSAVGADSAKSLKALIEDKAVLKIRGRFDSSRNAFSFKTGTDSTEREIGLGDAQITGLWIWRRRFGRTLDDATDPLALPVASRINVAVNEHSPRRPTAFACGSFTFHFHIFDFARGIDGRYALTQPEKNLVKGHRIYLYRDGVRVYPYGDPDDDWLAIDVTRGTGRAGNFFSNDQIIGWIDITQKDNPDLRDKTNREGLIETGGAAHHLIFLVQLFLSYVKQYTYARHQHKQRQRSTARLVQDGAVAEQLEHLKNDLTEAGHLPQAQAVSTIVTDYKREKQHLSQRAEITEDLAGVGLSVEMASHDIMLLMSRARELGRRLTRIARLSSDEDILELADMLVGVLQQVVDGMRDVQIMFKSSRRRRKLLRIAPILDKIQHIYSTVLDQRQIRYHKVVAGRLPLKASTTDGAVMQVLVNLFDNASYWLEAVDSSAREIRVTVDGDHGELVFSDSGPGIDSEDLPFIFEPFYSGKGQEGRGLGLYIARQLLERHDYSIAVAEDHRRVLPGANFVVNFVKDDI